MAVFELLLLKKLSLINPKCSVYLFEKEVNVYPLTGHESPEGE